MPEERPRSTAQGEPAGFLTESHARDLDAADELRHLREHFHVPEDLVYLNGNSLGLVCREAEAALARVTGEWATLGVRGWLDAERPWFFFSETLGAEMAELVGARPEEVVATGTTTTNIHALLSGFFQPEGMRRKILADELNFPTDIYALQSHLRLRGLDPEADLLLVRSEDGQTLDEDDIVRMMTDDVALAFFPTVLYRSGQLLDAERLCREAHARGLLFGLDCSHSVGVLQHSLSEWGVDFAVWCSYKYLNGGPGAPAFIFVNERHAEVETGMAGWFGYVKERQFDMLLDFQPQAGAGGWQISSPGILGSAPLEGALALTAQAGMERIEAKSRRLTEHLIALLETELSAPPYSFSTPTPRDPARRGGHVAIVRSSGARAVAAALRRRGVIADFRPPDTIRCAPTALYNTFWDVWKTVDCLRRIVDEGEHDRDLDGPVLVP